MKYWCPDCKQFASRIIEEGYAMQHQEWDEEEKDYTADGDVDFTGETRSICALCYSPLLMFTSDEQLQQYMEENKDE
jgi:hypothetical protein